MAFELQVGPLSFSPKRTNERLVYAFDFKNVLATGEIIASGVWNAYAVNPTTASVFNMIVGSPTIMSGSIIMQQVQGGTGDCLYELVCRVYTTSNNIIEENALLKVTDSAYV